MDPVLVSFYMNYPISPTAPSTEQGIGVPVIYVLFLDPSLDQLPIAAVTNYSNLNS